jgi:hypothetical protein
VLTRRLVILSALAAGKVKAESYMTQEQSDRYNAKLASFNSLDGVWEAVLSAPGEEHPTPNWLVRMKISSHNVALRMRHASKSVVIDVRRTVEYLDPSRLGMQVEANVNQSGYWGRLQFSLLRNEKDGGTFSVQYEEKAFPLHPGGSWAWYGPARRVHKPRDSARLRAR